MPDCQVCGLSAVTEILDLGRQPVCNRYLAAADAPEALFPLALGVCERCGAVQLTQWPPAEQLRPTVDWITYNEPEAHLDALAQSVARLPGLAPSGLVVGVSLKDETLLQRLSQLGVGRCYRLDERADLNIEGAGAGVETVQAQLTPERAAALVARHGPAQLVVARHIVEHAHSVRAFVTALKILLAPGGYLLLEAPDCQAALDLHDYTTLWEEHTLYFTSATFRSLFGQAGLSLAFFDVCAYPFENVLAGIGRLEGGAAAALPPEGAVAEERHRVRAFADGLADQRGRWGRFLAHYRRRGGSVAMLGAGHLGCAFVNFLELKDHLAFIVDDNPHKQGLCLPASRLPIRGPQALLDSEVRLCLLGLNPGAEEKVVARNRPYTDRGGQFLSIFPGSPRALRGP